jgi:hypothetical protein
MGENKILSLNQVLTQAEVARAFGSWVDTTSLSESMRDVVKDLAIEVYIPATKVNGLFLDTPYISELEEDTALRSTMMRILRGYDEDERTKARYAASLFVRNIGNKFLDRSEKV